MSTTTWRCRRCQRTGPREAWTPRNGVIECGDCLYQCQAVGLLEPVKETEMSDTKHSKEPWRVDPNDTTRVVDAAASIGIAECCQVRHYPEDIERADAARIVACVNALAGIDDPAAFVTEAKAVVAKYREFTEDRITDVELIDAFMDLDRIVPEPDEE